MQMRKVDGCDVEKFDTVDSSEKAIAILRDGWWPNRKEIRETNSFIIYIY